MRIVFAILAITAALAACSPKKYGAPQADLGERIYSGNCVPCHQQSGAGIPGAYPRLAGSPVDTAAVAKALGQ